ncbi:hypothetical protein [Rhodopseudomonas palustris]|uniref:Uncharacterized protein n=1 Tax=Rhodopseudomonas palustris (strain DX-1) TaxID=652103 RepID=E6VE78_RHOPX|nr:hypothetical protein [Rhodopseudomonas palustris]
MLCIRLAAHAAVMISLSGLVLSAAPAGAAPWRADEGNTRGWMLMSPQERIAHQARVRGFTDYAACEAYRAGHHALMVQRARERGLDLPGGGRDFCDHLKSRAD